MMPELYTIDELARSTALSRRTIYYYVSRGLVPPAGRGRGAKYGDEHYWRLLLIRALTDLGVPLDLIQRHVAATPLEHAKLLVGPMIPLADLRSALQQETRSIRRKLEPTSELDITNLGLEDPVALRHRLAILEEQLGRVEDEQRRARETLYRNLVSAGESPGSLPFREPAGASGGKGVRGDDLRECIGDLKHLIGELEPLVKSLAQRLPDEVWPSKGDFHQVSVIVLQSGEEEKRGGDGEAGNPETHDLVRRITQAVAAWRDELERKKVK
jgi:DNA-binding transcriptional MerR regulator